ncbi:hypothetical protein U1Q18_018170, partial [Sarracenia purpurea var. burkii]
VFSSSYGCSGSPPVTKMTTPAHQRRCLLVVVGSTHSAPSTATRRSTQFGANLWCQPSTQLRRTLIIVAHLHHASRCLRTCMCLPAPAHICTPRSSPMRPVQHHKPPPWVTTFRMPPLLNPICKTLLTKPFI